MLFEFNTRNLSDEKTLIYDADYITNGAIALKHQYVNCKKVLNNCKEYTNGSLSKFIPDYNEKYLINLNDSLHFKSRNEEGKFFELISLQYGEDGEFFILVSKSILKKLLKISKNIELYCSSNPLAAIEIHLKGDKIGCLMPCRGYY